jgi:hypothetical protein
MEATNRNVGTPVSDVGVGGTTTPRRPWRSAKYSFTASSVMKYELFGMNASALLRLLDLQHRKNPKSTDSPSTPNTLDPRFRGRQPRLAKTAPLNAGLSSVLTSLGLWMTGV